MTRVNNSRVSDRLIFVDFRCGYIRRLRVRDGVAEKATLDFFHHSPCGPNFLPVFLFLLFFDRPHQLKVQRRASGWRSYWRTTSAPPGGGRWPKKTPTSCSGRGNLSPPPPCSCFPGPPCSRKPYRCDGRKAGKRLEWEGKGGRVPCGDADSA